MIQLQALDQVLSADLQFFKLVIISKLTPSHQLQLSHSESNTNSLCLFPYGMSHALISHVPLTCSKE